jgi:endonuclease VIII
MRVMIACEAIVAVAFNIQIAEFHTQDSLRRRAGFASLGPALLAHDFNANEGRKDCWSIGTLRWAKHC